MNLDDAIKHCEEIAMDKTNLAQTLWDSKEKARCKECAEEHNQLAQWLIELKILKTEQQSSGSEIPNNCEMRDATLEERESIDKYIKSISKPTGVKFGALEQEPCEGCDYKEWLKGEVKPQTGHWEWVQYDSNPNIGNWHCSECRTIIPHMPKETDNTPIYKWCPNCDAKMEVEQNG